MSVVRYRVGASQPATHEYEVTVSIPEPLCEGTITLRLPAWIPGSYMIRDYARHVTAFEASAGSVRLPVNRFDKSTWQVEADGAAVTIALRVYAWDLSVRGAHLDLHHAYFNGACLFPEVVGYTGPVTLDIEPMPSLPRDAWVATSMRAHDVDARGFGTYECEDYEALLDHPVEIAEQTNIELQVRGIPHRLIVRGSDGFDEARLAEDCQKIFETHHELLGTPPDLDRYDVLAFAEVDIYGGLEHRWSTSLAISLTDLPQSDATHNATAYRKLLGLISHEYFHLWNVRRLRPQVFEPLDMSREVHTRLLWVFEGITSYFDDLALIRSGVIELEDYLELLAQNLTRVMRTPGRLRQSLADSSFDAWTRFYKQDENAPNAIVSYYAKGAAAALALDLKLRSETTTALDAVMRECWQRFYIDGKGMPEDGLEQVASELSGTDLTAWFDAAIRGTDDLDYAGLFQAVGVSMELRAASGPQDTGGVAKRPPAAGYLGLRLAAGQARVANVIKDSPAERGGVAAGDEIVAVNGLRATTKQLDQLLTQTAPGSEIELHVFRLARLRWLTLKATAAPLDTVTLSVVEDVDAAVRQRRAQWLWQRSDA